MIEEHQLIKLISDLEKFEESDFVPKGFNVFEALGMQTQEIRHSFFLAFLLNPRDQHPFRDMFVKEIVEEVAKSSSRFSQLKVKLSDYSDLTVRREWPTRHGRKIDLVMYSEQEKIVVVIENKIFAGESESQLIDYKVEIESDPRFEGYQHVFIYLTPSGDAPSCPGWEALSYKFIAGLVEDCVRNAKATTDTKITHVISDYSEILRRYVVGNDKLQDEIKKIYGRHQKVLDMIFDQIKPGAASPDFRAAYDKYFGEREKQFVVMSSRPKEMYFLTKNLLWLKGVEAEGDFWESKDYYGPFMLKIKIEPNKLRVQGYLGPLRGVYKTRRLEITNLLLQSIGKKGKRTEDDKWTQIFDRTVEIKDEEVGVDDYYNEIASICDSDVFKENISKIEQALAGVFPEIKNGAVQ